MPRFAALRELPRWLVWLILGSVILRVTLLGLPELLPEEAYYWNYAAHLAPGYLDHPPLSAWLIAAGTLALGLNEFGVRIGAIVCAAIAGWFVYATALRVVTKTAAITSTAIFLTAPYFLGNSFYITPDAPLVAAWSAAIFFLVRIVEREETSGWSDWLMLGISFGLGMLSKYSIALLALAAFFVWIRDAGLRRWFLKPQPYVAILLSAAIFSPVIYWNAMNEWASFAFQSSRRLSQAPEFGLGDLLAHLLLMASPVGLIVGVAVTYRIKPGGWLVGSDRVVRLLKGAFMLPIGIFLLVSFRHEPRINWCGPVFLAVLPFCGAHLLNLFQLNSRWSALVRRSWGVFLGISVGAFAAFWIYLGAGLPGIGYSKNMKKLIGWEDLGRHTLAIAEELTQAGGKPAFILGMDKHYTAAELAFYVRKAAQSREVETPIVAGRATVGIESLMWEYWSPKEKLAGRDAVLVTRNRGDLEFKELEQAFTSLGPIEEYRASANGKPAGIYQIRRAYGFRGDDMIENLRSLSAN